MHQSNLQMSAADRNCALLTYPVQTFSQHINTVCFFDQNVTTNRYQASTEHDWCREAL